MIKSDKINDIVIIQYKHIILYIMRIQYIENITFCTTNNAIDDTVELNYFFTNYNYDENKTNIYF